MAAFLLPMINRVVPAGLVKSFDSLLDPERNKKLLDKAEEIRYNSRIEKKIEDEVSELCRKNYWS